MSEVLTLGVPDADSAVVLLAPEREIYFHREKTEQREILLSARIIARPRRSVDRIGTGFGTNGDARTLLPQRKGSGDASGVRYRTNGPSDATGVRSNAARANSIRSSDAVSVLTTT